MNRTLTRRIAFIEQFDLFVGIDLGKHKNVAVMMDQRFKRYGRFEFGHSREDYDRLAAWLRKNQAGVVTPRVLVGMEPTNDYWQWVATYLEEMGIPYRLVNAFAVKKSREGTQLDYAKDDNRDSATITRLLIQGVFTETQIPTGIYAQMRHYEQAHWQLSHQIGQQKTVLRQHVERLFPELQKVWGDYTGKTALAFLKNHADPHIIAQMDWDTFEARVRQDFAGEKLAVKKLRQVYQLAANSIGVQPGCALQHLIRQHIVTWSYQQQQLAELEAELVNCLYQLPTVTYLLSLGLGKVTTALIAAELGDPSRFSAAKQLVKLAGIQPTANQSGEYKRQKTPMSHKGRVRLRTYLFFATMRLIRWDASFQQKHQALINRPSRPLKPLESVGALMNKLIQLIWAVSRDQMMYSPQQFLAN